VAAEEARKSAMRAKQRDNKLVAANPLLAKQRAEAEKAAALKKAAGK
jgi:hypothetical protein